MEYKFTKDITGSNNGIVVEDYKEGQIIDEKDLCEVLFDAWKEQEVIIPVGEEANTGDEEVDDFLNGKTDKLPDGTEEITIEEGLVEEAKKILAEEEVDTDKLKEIGIALKIAGMNKTVNPEKIVEKIEKFIEEHTEEEQDEANTGDEDNSGEDE